MNLVQPLRKKERMRNPVKKNFSQQTIKSLIACGLRFRLNPRLKYTLVLKNLLLIFHLLNEKVIKNEAILKLNISLKLMHNLHFD